MGLKAVLTEDDLEALDEASRTLYTQAENGRYVLDVDDADDLPQIRNLKSAYESTKTKRDEARRQAEALKRKFGPLADLEDLDLSDAEQDRLERLLPYLKGEAEIPDDPTDDKAKGKKPGDQIDLDKIKANARKPVERERDEITQERDTLKAQLQSLVTDSALTGAIAEIKVSGPFTKAVKAMFRDRVKVIEGDDGQPVAVIEGEYGEQPVDKYLKEWAQTDEGREFVQAPGSSGGGARGGTGNGKVKNPWSKDSWSPKEQGRIYREHGKDVAARMAAEHGHKVL